MSFLHRTWAEIDISALIHNFNIIKKQSGNMQIMAVVKANAYGHSDKDIAPLLDKLGADSFAVSNIEEALRLRECGIKKPILILGYTPENFADKLINNNIIQTVYSAEYAENLNAVAEGLGKQCEVHIKLDTGMGRLGYNMRSDELSGMPELLKAFTLKGLKITGTFTHFAVADSNNADDADFTKAQAKRFKAAIKNIESAGFNAGMLHISNSAGIAAKLDLKLDICRPGIILYGLTPSNDIKMPLTPVMTLKSAVSMVKTIDKGETLSYGRTFTADKQMRVATVSAGYADGYPRLLSNTAEVLIAGKKAKILGRICMDQFICDVTNIPEAKKGDEVILFGEALPIDILADACGTINYEIICGISPRVPRIIKNQI